MYFFYKFNLKIDFTTKINKVEVNLLLLEKKLILN